MCSVYVFLLLLLFVCAILSVLCLQVAAERGEARRRPIIINSDGNGNGEPNGNGGCSKSSKCRRGYASSSDDDGGSGGGASSGYDGYRCVVRQLCSGTVQP